MLFSELIDFELYIFDDSIKKTDKTARKTDFKCFNIECKLKSNIDKKKDLRDINVMLKNASIIDFYGSLLLLAVKANRFAFCLGK